MSKVILEGYIDVPEQDMGAVLNELQNHIELTRSEDGCIIFEITRDKKSPNRFNVYEEFTDSESFELHQSRVKKSRWGKISENVVRNYSVNYQK